MRVSAHLQGIRRTLCTAMTDHQEQQSEQNAKVFTNELADEDEPVVAGYRRATESSSVFGALISGTAPGGRIRLAGAVSLFRRADGSAGALNHSSLMSLHTNICFP